MRFVPSFLLLHMKIQVSQHHRLKRLLFSHWMVLESLSIVNRFIYVWVYFWTLNSIPLVSMSILLSILDYFLFVVIFETEKCWVLWLGSFSRLLLLFRAQFHTPSNSIEMWESSFSFWKERWLAGKRII